MRETSSKKILLIGTFDTKMMNFFIHQIERFEFN